MSRAIHNVQIMQKMHNAFGVFPPYEDILEFTYRKLIKAGDVVVDIGAYSGRHTSIFAALVGEEGRVHAFEPLPEAIEYFTQQTFPACVRLHQQAIGMVRGETSFVHARGAPEESGFKIKAYNRPEQVCPETISVHVSPLDDLLLELGPVGFIKIAAVGAEILCLQSAVGLVAKNRPWIALEYGFPSYSAFGFTKQSLFQQALAMRYVIGDLFGGVCETAEHWDRICDVAYWDWYLMPREKVAQWRSVMLTS